MNQGETLLLGSGIYWPDIFLVCRLMCLYMLYSPYLYVNRDIISLHTHSVWETICHAKASRVWHGMAKFLLFLPRIPYPRADLDYPTPPPIPHPHSPTPKIGSLSFDFSRIYPYPKIEIWPGLGTLDFNYSRLPPQPPPLPKIEIWPGVWGD